MASEGFTGMASLINGIERMGERVQAEAAVRVRYAAQSMRGDVAQLYPRKTGTLQDRVTIEGQGLRWKVRSKAPHAHLFELGTVTRYTASTGANRGRMQATPTFIPAAIRARGRMVDELTRLLVRQTVPGMDGRMEVRR